MPPEVPGVGFPHFAASDVVVLYVAGLLPLQVQKLVDATVFDAVTPERNVTSPSAPGGGAAATDIPLALVASVSALPEPDVPGRTGSEKSVCVSKRSGAPGASEDRSGRNLDTAFGQRLVSRFSCRGSLAPTAGSVPFLPRPSLRIPLHNTACGNNPAFRWRAFRATSCAPVVNRLRTARDP